MQSQNRKKKRPEPIPEPELTDEEKLVLELAQLRAHLEPLYEQIKPLEKRYDEIRKGFIGEVRNGRNSPFEAPGWRVTFTARPVGEYTVEARTDYRINILAMVPAKVE